MNTQIPKRLLLTFALIMIAIPVRTGSKLEPYTQEFLITAYYSALPHQCCYVTGGYESDKYLNGQGIKAADGTAVYPGMIAAPPSYAFGSKVTLPGLGTFTVHDRGGAIQELGSGLHRLDIWVGHGEEALARALNLGLVKLKGTVYPPAFDQPATHFAMEDLNASFDLLKTYKLGDTTLLSVRPKVGERSLSTTMLQEELKDLGYFKHAVTGLFGSVTRRSLAQFIRDYEVQDSATELSRKTAAFILSASYRKDAKSPVVRHIDRSASPAVVQQAQRTLRFLGYYKGRTDGEYDEDLMASIMNFQKDHGLIGDASSPGAGRIGPITLKKLKGRWDQKLVASKASRLLLRSEVERRLAERGRVIDQFLGEGNNGSQVHKLQRLLADRGFFPEDEINGNFGRMTKNAVIDFQLNRGLITSEFDKGAGYVGPQTLTRLKNEERDILYRLVRAEGKGVL